MNADKTLLSKFIHGLQPDFRQAFTQLSTPFEIQAFLDSIPYAGEDRNRSVHTVLRERHAHCLDGGLFAAAALWHLGFPPLVIDLLPAPNSDDDHVLAIYKIAGRFGAVAKSNFVGLRFRDPVYSSLRELVMSYFEPYFNVNGVKTLRAYTRPVRLARFDKANWLEHDRSVDAFEKHLKRLKPIPLLTPEMARIISPVDARSYQANMMGTDSAGLYKPSIPTP
jgi:hypothetical protein